MEYIRTNEPDNIHRVGNSYRLKDHPSLAVKEGGWYWHSRNIGGRTALDFLTDVRGYGLVDAVCRLLGENAKSKLSSPPKRKLDATSRCFTLPRRAENNKFLMAYLQSRGIDKQIILDCIKRRQVYQRAVHNDCVFVGRDETGKARYACIRGTNGGFKQDIMGSEKRYGFTLPPQNPKSREIAVFEAAIDVLSHQTLCKQGFIPHFDGWRLSLGGTSLLALEQFLRQHPDINRCLVCTDNDKAGNEAAAKIKELPGIMTEHCPPFSGKDWNEMLMSVQKTERMQNRVRRCDTPVFVKEKV